ncbi:hypothetical protein GCM10009801_44440 [Streptomyces albiaxialis]|uniref:Methyltransferase n=1 Tax=Streptomyces albiaxialis TaxID=329523 RepID=A0ABN2W703_9ACTN
MIPWDTTSLTPSPAPGAAPSPRFLAALRDLAEELPHHHYTDKAVAALLGAADGTDLLRNSALYALWSRDRVTELAGEPAGLLTQLFFRNGEVPAAAWSRRLSARLRTALDTLGLVEEHPGAPGAGGGPVLTARAALSPYEDGYYLSDPLFACRAVSHGYPAMAGYTAEGLDPVMPPHASTLRLAAHRGEHGGRLLDVGTGSGVLALDRAHRYEAVAGVDIDPRAVGYARLNARLAHVEAAFEVADFREGLDAFGPVDHLVFNAPGRAPLKGDGNADTAHPLSAEKLLQDIARRLPGVLARPGGVAEALVIVAVPGRHPDAAATVDEWLAGTESTARLTVTEVRDQALSIPAQAIEKLRIQPGCLLANGREDAESLIAALKAAGIREVTPAIVTVVRD